MQVCMYVRGLSNKGLEPNLASFGESHTALAAKRTNKQTSEASRRAREWSAKELSLFYRLIVLHGGKRTGTGRE